MLLDPADEQQPVGLNPLAANGRPPELVADLMYRGIALAGGGAMLRGLDRRLAQETRFPVYVAEDPLLCVVKGTGEVLEEAKMLQKVQSALAARKPPRTRGGGAAW